MSILDRLRGMGAQRPLEAQAGESSPDEQAIARYRYLLRTAPPETLEQAHAEAFAQLTPAQRRRVLQELAANMSTAERMAAARAPDDAEVLARMATRAEMRQPGTLERALAGIGAAPSYAAPGMGGLFAGSFLSSMAGTVLGGLIAQQFFASHAQASHLFGGEAAAAHDATSAPDASAAGLIHDPFQDAHDIDSGDFDTGDVGSADFGGGDSFDV